MTPDGCPQCEAMRRVLDAAQKISYEHDKARVESDARARAAEARAELAESRLKEIWLLTACG